MEEEEDDEEDELDENPEVFLRGAFEATSLVKDDEEEDETGKEESRSSQISSYAAPARMCQCANAVRFKYFLADGGSLK